MTHRDLLPLISGMQPLEVAIQSRILKFVKTLKESENKLVKYIVNHAATAPGSTLGRNIRSLSSKMNKTYEDMVYLSTPKVKESLFEIWSGDINEDYIARANVIKELRLVRENLLIIDFGLHRIMDIISCDIIVNNLCVF